MFVTLLLTALSLLASGIATHMAILARTAAHKAETSEHRLAIMRGQVRGLEVALVALDESHKKLQGQFHASKRWGGQAAPDVPIDNDPAGVACENWLTAQRDGPSSPAAGCECTYCNVRRRDRAERRAKLRSGVKS